MVRAALYARVSTEMQEKEQTIQSQLGAISQYADAHHFSTSAALTYTDEGFSGTHLDRPALDELRDHAREGRFEVLVVLCPDRLARKYAYQVLLLEEFKRAGIEVHFCERPISESPDDQLLLQIQGAVAEYERAKILERARRGRLHRARLGELGPSRVPYGYRYAAKKQGGDGQIHVHEEEAAMVRQIFDWYATEGETLYGLLKKLNASEWWTRAGRKEWGATTILRLRHCQWYIGTAYYNRTRSVRNERRGDYPGKTRPLYDVTERPKVEWIAVAVPALVDGDLFARVQQRIQENRRFARRRLTQDERYLLRGLLKCGVCGHAYVAETRADERYVSASYLYHYYTCGMRMAPLPDAFRSRCKNERLRAAGVDEAVWTTVRDLLLNSQTFTSDLNAWASRTSTATPESERQLQQAESRVRDIERQRDRLTDAYQLGALTLEVFRTRTQGLETSRLAAESALSDLRAEHLASEVAQSRAVGALTVVQQLRPALMNADFNTRQTILRLLVERVVVTGQHLEIHLAVPVSGNFDLTSEYRAPRNPAQLLEGVRWQRMKVATSHLARTRRTSLVTSSAPARRRRWSWCSRLASRTETCPSPPVPGRPALSRSASSRLAVAAGAAAARSS